MLETLSILRYYQYMTVRSMFGSDNATSAGNQQERVFATMPANFGWYIAGFVDGEGSFNVSFKKERSYGIGWKVALSFNISQRDAGILRKIQQAFGCGTIRFRQDGVGYFEIRSLDGLKNVVIPFFNQYQLQSKKRADFDTFCAIANMVFAKRHLTYNGMKELLALRENMNGGGKRKFTSQTILSQMRIQSSETIRQTRSNA